MTRGLELRPSLVALAIACACSPDPSTGAPRGKASPSTRAEAFVADVDALEEVMKHWWANRRVHEEKDGVDVSAVFARLRARLGGTDDFGRFAALLRDALHELDDGHIVLERADGAASRGLASGLAFVDTVDGIALSYFDRERYGAQAPELADKLIAIDGKLVDEALRASTLNPGSTEGQRRLGAIRALNWQRRYGGEEPAPRFVVLERPSGANYTVTVEWIEPKPVAEPKPATCVTGRMLDDGIGYVEVRTFWCTGESGQRDDALFREQLARAMRIAIDARGLVVDLRENGGGADAEIQALAGVFWNGSLELYRSLRQKPFVPVSASPVVTTVELERNDATTPQFTGRPVFLVGPGCFSACDIFAAVARAHGATLAGAATAAGSGDPLEHRLPYSGFVVRVPSLEVYQAGSDTAPVEANSVAPDWPLARALADVRVGRDTVLEEAARRLREELATP